MKPGGLLISIDAPDGPGGGGARAWDDLQDSAKIVRDRGFRVHVIEGLSSSPEVMERVRDILGERKINILVIDGDHGPGAAYADWTRFSPLLDGLGIWHDCGVPNGLYDLSTESIECMRWTRAGFDCAAVGHCFATLQDDFGTGLIWS